MRVINAEALDAYLTDVIRGVKEAAYLHRSGKGLMKDVTANMYEEFAQNLSIIADHIADDMVEEGEVYKDNHAATPPHIIGDISGDMGRRQIHPLHSHE